MSNRTANLARPAKSAPKSKQIVTEVSSSTYKNDPKLLAIVVPGESIRIVGRVRADGSGRQVVKPGKIGELWTEFVAGGREDRMVLKLILDAMEDQGYEYTDFLRRELQKVEYIVNGQFSMNVEKDWQDFADLVGRHCHTWEHDYKPYDRTWKIGENAEHGSYNLSYYGRITAITAKTIEIEDDCHRGSVKRLKLDSFAWRNLDWYESKAAKRNSEWMD